VISGAIPAKFRKARLKLPPQDKGPQLLLSVNLRYVTGPLTVLMAGTRIQPSVQGTQNFSEIHYKQVASFVNFKNIQQANCKFSLNLL
jgi:hypothetical protein